MSQWRAVWELMKKNEGMQRVKWKGHSPSQYVTDRTWKCTEKPKGAVRSTVLQRDRTHRRNIIWEGSASTILAGWSMRVASQSIGPNASSFPVLILKIARHLLVGLKIRVLKDNGGWQPKQQRAWDRQTHKQEAKSGRQSPVFLGFYASGPPLAGAASSG